MSDSHHREPPAAADGAPESNAAPSEVWPRRAAIWSAGWLLAAAFYLLLIDITDLPELLVGAGAAVIAATAYVLGHEQYLVVETILPGWLYRLGRPLLKVPGDSWAVSVVALRQLVRPRAVRGQFRAARFRCGENEARQTGRSALAESAGSFAPNTIIIGIDEERELILGHQLRPTGGSEVLDVLELG